MPPKPKNLKGLQQALQSEIKEGKEAKINLGETSSLKRALDEAVLEELKHTDYAIDYTYFDIKLALGLAACAVACLAQFYPLKYPANFWLLVVCVGAYAALSTAMSVVASFLERDGIAFTQPSSKKGGAAIVIGSKLPRFQDVYQLRIQLRGAPRGRDEVVLKKSVAAYFDSEGHLAGEVVRRDFRELLQRFEAECSRVKKAE